MTNEEKAKEIAEFFNRPNGCTCLLPCHQAAMAMAEWKDKQYAKIVAKLIVESNELKHQVKSLLP